MNMKTFLEKTADFRTSSTFRSYVPNIFVQQHLSLQENHYYTAPPPHLLSGEIIINEAHRVLLFSHAIDKKKGLMGNLFVTNFRIFLTPTDGTAGKDTLKQNNLLIGEYGVSLSNIGSVSQISGNKARKLFSNTNITGHVKELQLVCKNMRVLTFGFEQSPREHGNKIAKTILHHAFPGRHALLFAYEYSEPGTSDPTAQDVIMFTNPRDWDDEIKRTCRERAGGWRVSVANSEKFSLSEQLPKWVVVPKCVVDADLLWMSGAFRCNRPPTWTWSHRNGAALVRMADCLPAITDRKQENSFMESLRGLHPEKKAPVIMDLDRLLPSIRDIQISFIKLQDLCVPESKRQFEMQESRFQQFLDNSKWLSYVSACLKEAITTCESLKCGISVVLQESDGCDTSAVVASLVQLILDPRSRTIVGFQSLIQKEWVAMGHPFCTRLGLLRATGNEQSPVFLLFLDCVWQLQRQCLTAFEFSETYLTTLYDSCYVTVFDTFIFDNERDRINAVKTESLQLRSVWNWKKQFSESDIALFYNPLYQLENIVAPLSTCTVEPNYEVSLLEMWSQCYFRWFPVLGIQHGGRPQVDLIHRWLRTDIERTITTLRDLTKKTHIELSRNLSPNQETSVPCLNNLLETELNDSILLEQSRHVDNFYPFSSCDDSLSSFFGDSSTLSDFDSPSLLNLTA